MGYTQEHLERRKRLGMGVAAPMVKAPIPAPEPPPKAVEVKPYVREEEPPSDISIIIEAAISELVKRILPSLVTREIDRLNQIQENADWKEVVNDVCERHGIPVSQVMGLSRADDVVKARAEVIYMMSTLSNMSSMEIGKALNKDSSTVRHILRKFKGQKANERDENEV